MFIQTEVGSVSVNYETIKLDAEAVNNLTGDDGSLVISIAVFGKLKSLDKGIILDEDELVNGKLSIYNGL